MKELTILLIAVIVFGIFFNKIKQNLNLTSVESTVDGREYTVRKLPDKLDAANKLAEINKSLTKLVKFVYEDKNKDTDKVKGILQLYTKFDPNNLTENTPGGKYTAYSVNKGEQLALCLRNVPDNTFIDNNTIYFVAIHELAHIMTDEIGHTPKFWSNMKYLLHKAHGIGVYNPVDYKKKPVDYCGQEINSTPYGF